MIPSSASTHGLKNYDIGDITNVRNASSCLTRNNQTITFQFRNGHNKLGHHKMVTKKSTSVEKHQSVEHYYNIETIDV